MNQDNDIVVKSGDLTMSDDIKEIAAALCKAQSQMTVVKRSAANPFLKSTYSDLADVWKAIREPLTKNNMCLVQHSKAVANGGVQVLTRLVHTSGQWFAGEIVCMPTAKGPQGQGSALTYARRYGAMALVGAVQEGEDDDGNGAESGGKPDEDKPKGEIQRELDALGRTKNQITQAKGDTISQVSFKDLGNFLDFINQKINDEKITLPKAKMDFVEKVERYLELRELLK